MSANMLDQCVDVVLVGAGVMSATLGTLLKELQPELSIEIFERLDRIADESSDALNNAGTGHSAYCELNYTPERADGSIDISKAIKINESFEISRQFWAYLVQHGIISSPQSFINNVPHMSFVHGEKNVTYLRKRYAALQQHPLFQGMQYSEDHEQLRAWMPLVMENRDSAEQVAATRMEIGTDVNFGNLSRMLFDKLSDLPDVSLHVQHEVRDLKRDADGRWHITVKDLESGITRSLSARFVFLGAGGGALPLLLRSGIPERRGFGGFPVSGQWLICTNPELIARHHAKVYGKASVGTPPMSVPHLDTRIIDGQPALLFGPYAGFTTKFLKHGSLLDFPLSIRPSNVYPMMAAGLQNIPLTKYLIEQVLQSADARLEALREFVPNARKEDWRLEVAGQRVQVIKHDPQKGGVLEFGTEIVNAADGSIAALLGASPGASTSVAIMLDLLGRCFPSEMQSSAWQAKLKQMIPSFGQSLASNSALAESVRSATAEVLGLNTNEENTVPEMLNLPVRALA